MMILRRLITLFDVFHQKHALFMEEFATTNCGGNNGGKPAAPKDRQDKDEPKKEFEEDNADMEDLFEFDKKPAKKKFSISEEADLETQQWKDFVSLLTCIKVWADWVISTKPRFPPQQMNDLKTK